MIPERLRRLARQMRTVFHRINWHHSVKSYNSGIFCQQFHHGKTIRTKKLRSSRYNQNEADNMKTMQFPGPITALILIFNSPFLSDPVAAEESSPVRLKSVTEVRVVKKVHVNVNPERDLHGPCVVRAGNNDLLLCHRDSLEHIGGDSFVRQWRSTDNGFTWQDEGPVADWRNRQIDSSLGEYGKTPDGKLIMFVQCRKLRSGEQGVIASWLQTSDDHGKS